MILLLLVLSLVMSISVAEMEKNVSTWGREKELGIHYGNFKAHENSYLVLDKVGVSVRMVHSFLECGSACVKHYFCLSFNVAIRPNRAGYFVCELLASDKYSSSSNFTSSKDFHHYSIVTPCLSNQCKNGASCIPRYQDDTYTCVCVVGYTGPHCTAVTDCRAIKSAGVKKSGIYPIYPGNSGHVSVYCDMVTDGGGWTVIQRRIDGSVDFYLDWNSYKGGFGNLSREFWLGNDNIHLLTTSGNTVLRVELEDWSNNTAYAVYGTFMVDDENNKYKLTVGSYSGTAGDSLASHNGMFFTTKDRDNDQIAFNCANLSTGAWWYTKCHFSNLNGLYRGNTAHVKGINWWSWRSSLSLKRSTMMIRRHV